MAWLTFVHTYVGGFPLGGVTVILLANILEHTFQPKCQQAVTGILNVRYLLVGLSKLKFRPLDHGSC
jgi:hypothetical protein